MGNSYECVVCVVSHLFLHSLAGNRFGDLLHFSSSILTNDLAAVALLLVSGVVVAVK